jgi:hypothetical protein
MTDDDDDDARIEGAEEGGGGEGEREGTLVPKTTCKRRACARAGKERASMLFRFLEKNISAFLCVSQTEGREIESPGCYYV